MNVFKTVSTVDFQPCHLHWWGGGRLVTLVGFGGVGRDLRDISLPFSVFFYNQHVLLNEQKKFKPKPVSVKMIVGMLCFC